MRKTLLPFLLSGLVLLNFDAFSQLKSVSIGLAPNHTFVKDVFHDDKLDLFIPASTGFTTISTPIRVKESFTGRNGLDVNGRFDYAITKRLFFSGGLSVSYLRFKHAISIESISSNNESELQIAPDFIARPYGSLYTDSTSHTLLAPSEKIGETTSLYIQLPFLVGTTVLKDKITIRAGLNISYLIRATEYKQGYSFTSGLYEYKDISTANFAKLQASALINASYLFTKKIGIDLTIQSYLSPFYKGSDGYRPKATYTALALGVTYRLK